MYFYKQNRPKIIVKTFTEFFSEIHSSLIVLKGQIRPNQKAFFRHK